MTSILVACTAYIFKSDFCCLQQDIDSEEEVEVDGMCDQMSFRKYIAQSVAQLTFCPMYLIVSLYRGKK
jgi:hypothetical protein